MVSVSYMTFVPKLYQFIWKYRELKNFHTFVSKLYPFQLPMWNFILKMFVIFLVPFNMHICLLPPATHINDSIPLTTLYRFKGISGLFLNGLLGFVDISVVAQLFQFSYHISPSTASTGSNDLRSVYPRGI